KCSLRHLSRGNLLRIQAAKLHRTEHIAGLIEWRVAAVERAPHLRGGAGLFMSHALDQKIDALLGRPFAEMKFEGKDDPCAAVGAPEKRADAVLRGRDEFQIPEVKFPPHRPAFDPKWSLK